MPQGGFVPEPGRQIVPEARLERSAQARRATSRRGRPSDRDVVSASRLPTSALTQIMGPMSPSPDPAAQPSDGEPSGYDPIADPQFAPDEVPDAFDELVVAALDSLPPVFRDRLGSVAVVVEDEPTQDQLASVGAAGLLGLYTGVPRTSYGADEAAVASKITIFSGPHLRLFRDPDSLARGVAETVRHEVAHHFGISDARLEELARGHR